MNSKLILRLIMALVVPALACTMTSTTLPATSTPEAEQAPTSTPEGGGVDANGLFVLNLSESDQKGLELRADEILQSILDGGGEVDRGVLLQAYAELAQLQHVGGEWHAIGPAPIQGVFMPQGQVPGSGRVNGFAVDPRNTNVVYAAASIGGLWKTEDGGQSWRSLSEQQVPLIYGGIVIDPSNPDTLYALLGEFDGQVSYAYGYLANGIMRTQDAGATWQLVGEETFLGASVTSLEFAPDGTLYASSGQMSVYYGPPNMPDFGVFRSTDGGDSWDRLASCSDFGSCVPRSGGENRSLLGGFFDLKVASNGNLFTSFCIFQCFSTSILRSTDGGQVWEQLDLQPALEDWSTQNEVTVEYLDDAQTLPAIDGFELSVSKTDSNIVLAGGGVSYQDQKQNEGVWSWIIRSQDGGDSWQWLPEAGDYCSGTGGSPQCTYDNIIEIDPTDPNIMYAGGSFSIDPDNYNWIAVIRRSADGGDTWADLTPAVDGSLMHPDAHGMSFDPTDPARLWVGTDGGIYRTDDASADPPQWQSVSEGLNTLLFIDVALHPTDPSYLVGGMQDNAKAYTNDRGTWHGAASGDGAYVAVDPFQPNIVYGTIYPPSIFERNENGGEGDFTEWNPSGDSNGYNAGLDSNDNWAFYPTFAVDPNNEGVLYLVSNRVYRTDDRGDSWTPVSDYLNASELGNIQSIELAPSDSNVIYVGTTDGTAWVSTDGAQSWGEITGANFPPRNLNRLAVDPNDPNTLVAVFGGFNVQTPDSPGHVFVSRDGGGSWEDISFALPDAPLSSVVIDVREQYAGVYVGGALGVWVLQQGTSDWLPYGTGMPFALVSSLKLNPATGVMAAATYGRSVWVLDMP